MIYDDLLEEIDLLGDIRLHEIGDRGDLLLFADFCRINKLIKKYTHPVMVPSLTILMQQRRDALDSDEDDRYRELALQYSE